MPLIELTREEIEAFLARGRVVRVCFQAGEERHLVPLGYVWCRGALCGSMTEGRKTRLARANPRVAFQVDDTREAGLWEWSSVSGEGVVEWVEDPEEAREIGRLLSERWPDMPGWLAEELEELEARGEVALFRIRPTRTSGVRSAPPGRAGDTSTSSAS